MVSLGDQLEDLLASASHQIVIAAPYIKANVLQRLLEVVRDGVSLKCVTRWRPEEIVAGVTDIEVWPLVRGRPNSSLWLRLNLHAKYYRGDDRCLVGSANLTSAALGWSPNPNLELLLEMSFTNSPLRTFEEELLSNCTEVDAELYNHIRAVVSMLEGEDMVPRPNLQSEEVSGTSKNFSSGSSPSEWLPSTRNPEDLYVAYTGAFETLTAIERESTVSDLRALGITVSGLSRDAFRAYVGAILLQHSTIRQVDTFVREPRRFGAIRDFLTSLPCARRPGFDATREWQTLMRWLLYFIPGRYCTSTPHYTEIFWKVEGGDDGVTMEQKETDTGEPVP